MQAMCKLLGLSSMSNKASENGVHPALTNALRNFRAEGSRMYVRRACGSNRVFKACTNRGTSQAYASYLQAAEPELRFIQGMHSLTPWNALKMQNVHAKYAHLCVCRACKSSRAFEAGAASRAHGSYVQAAGSQQCARQGNQRGCAPCSKGIYSLRGGVPGECLC